MRAQSLFFRRFGAWAKIPDKFREFAAGSPEWTDVLALLPQPAAQPTAAASTVANDGEDAPAPDLPAVRHAKLDHRPTYGNPIDFRGLRHEPVNEQGVVFLFGMLARELGYYVEAVQTGFPDCEAKRQIGPDKWQRVRIEFEFESRNFREHGHDPTRCDVIVCWRHNWTECPGELEVVELASLIKSLPTSED